MRENRGYSIGFEGSFKFHAKKFCFHVTSKQSGVKCSEQSLEFLEMTRSAWEIFANHC